MIDDVYQLSLAAVRRHLRQSVLSIMRTPAISSSAGIDSDCRSRLRGSADKENRPWPRWRCRFISMAMREIGFASARSVLARLRKKHCGLPSMNGTCSPPCPCSPALGAEAAVPRRPAVPVIIAGWRLFAGRAGLRGTVPPGLHAGGTFFTTLLMGLRDEISRWDEPRGLFAAEHPGAVQRRAR